jgi:hypothetical protein
LSLLRDRHSSAIAKPARAVPQSFRYGDRAHRFVWHWPGPTFFTPEWRELYRHALREADRLGLEMSLNIQSGWNLGGPMVPTNDAAKKLVWSETRAAGPARFAQGLPEPKHVREFYQDLFVVAFRLESEPGERNLFTGVTVSSEQQKQPRNVQAAEPKLAGPDGTGPASGPTRRPIQNWQEKAMHRALHFSAPDTTPLLLDAPAEAGEEDARAEGVADLTARLDENGVLRWDVPEGTWEILRFGCTIGDHSHVLTSSDGWKGYALDVLDEGAFRRYWDAVVEPLIADAGPLAGRTLKYLHTDSWEVEAINWTPTLREQFRQRRGYDFVPFLPVLAGRIVNSRPESNRFLHDFRKTLGDLAVDHHYKPFLAWAHQHGLQIHPESGGPHAVPIDAQRCLGQNDVPMSEFWAWSWRHRVGDTNRFFVKQPASAAHTHGRRLVAAEGFTTIGPHGQETLWDNLKPAFDRAACEGLNLLVWHAFVCSPEEMGLPGQQDYPRCDDEVRALADELWADCDGVRVRQHAFGQGRIFHGWSAREVLLADGVPPDFECSGADAQTALDYIHRQDSPTEIYFVANCSNRWRNLRCTFRVAGLAPALWNPLTGDIRPAAAWSQQGGRTTLPLEFAPYGSWFVVFRRAVPPDAGGTAPANSPHLSPIHRLSGPWAVAFDPKWGGPDSVEFPELISWTEQAEPGIRFYSGTTTYRKGFDLPATVLASERLFLDLGEVRELAEVRLNGRDLGVLWAVPFRVEVTGALRPADNQLEIEVVNFWPNRIIGDQSLPPEQRRTRTNIRKLTSATPLMPSGLLGPVTLQAAAGP